MLKFQEEIKNRNFKGVYLFFGEEKFLINRAVEKLKNSLLDEMSKMMNYNEFEGDKCSIDSITESVDTFPFMAEYRLVLVKNSKLFAEGRSADSNIMSEFLAKKPSTTILVFVEEKVDKRLKLYKTVSKFDGVLEFKTPDNNNYIKWIIGEFKSRNNIIDNQTALYLINYVNDSMEKVLREIEKLSLYKKDGEILKENIDLLCTKSTESVIFDLVDAVGSKNTSKAIEIYNNILFEKGSPFMVLSMISRQFKNILLVKYMQNQKKPLREICEKLSLREFVAKKYMVQGKNFKMITLLQAIKECNNCDFEIKSGKINQEKAVEMLIIKYSL